MFLCYNYSSILGTTMFVELVFKLLTYFGSFGFCWYNNYLVGYYGTDLMISSSSKNISEFSYNFTLI